VTDRRAAITGIGVITPIGTGLAEFARGLREGRSGIGDITNFDAERLPVRRAAEARDFDLARHISSMKTYLDRASAFSLAAASMALRQAAWPKDGVDAGLCLGSAWGCQDTIELYTRKLVESDPKFAPPLVFTHSYANAPNSLVAIEFALRGHNACFAGGAGAGADALQHALDMVRAGQSRRLLAGGVDVVSEIALRAMIADGLASVSGVGRPFDPAADGLVPGEGAGLLALESPQSAACRNAAVLGYLLGAGSAAAPDPEAAVAGAVAAALADAGVDAGEIGLILASACGIPRLDAAEAAAIARLFPARPPVAALKSLLGDPLGAWAPVAVAAAVASAEAALPPAACPSVGGPPPGGIDLLREPLPPGARTCLILNVAPSGTAAAIVAAVNAHPVA